MEDHKKNDTQATANDSLIVYRFVCHKCGAANAAKKNNHNEYVCQYCEATHVVTADDADVQAEYLGYSEIQALQIELGKRQLKEAMNDDMKAMVESTRFMGVLRRLLKRYEGKSREECIAIDRSLKQQQAEQLKRLAEEKDIAEKMVSLTCPQCGVPVKYLPSRKLENFLCTFCSAELSIDDASQTKAQTTMNLAEMGKRMHDIPKLMHTAGINEDWKTYVNLKKEAEELNLKYAANFDLSLYTQQVAENPSLAIKPHEQDKEDEEVQAALLKVKRDFAHNMEGSLRAIEISQEDNKLSEIINIARKKGDDKLLSELYAKKEALHKEFEMAKYYKAGTLLKLEIVMKEIGDLDPTDYGGNPEPKRRELLALKEQFIREAPEAPEVVQKMVKDTEEMLALHYAAKKLVEAKSASGNDKLLNAAEKGDLDTVKKLLFKPGADATIYAETPEGEWLGAVMVRSGNLNAVRFYLDYLKYEKSNKDVDQCDHQEYRGTILHTAVTHNQLEIAEFLLQRGAKVDYKNRKGKTPLDLAATATNEAMIELLIRYSADTSMLPRRYQKSAKQKSQVLEDAFYNKNSTTLLESLSQLKEMDTSQETLKKISGIENSNLFYYLSSNDVKPESLAALVLIPVIMVAWADGDLNEKKKNSILKTIDKKALLQSKILRELLQPWLTYKPTQNLQDTWCTYLKDLKKSFDTKYWQQLKEALLYAAMELAKATGGFLGGGSLSKEEQAVIAKLEEAFC